MISSDELFEDRPSSIRLPWRITAIRSAQAVTSAILWVISTTALPAAARSRTKP